MVTVNDTKNVILQSYKSSLIRMAELVRWLEPFI